MYKPKNILSEATKAIRKVRHFIQEIELTAVSVWVLWHLVKALFF